MVLPKSLPSIVALTLSLAASNVSAADPDPLVGFDAAVAKAMKVHGVPGLGVAIVKDGKIVMAKGYGVRSIGKPELVTEKSLFAIGSVSKSFTVLCLAVLVDEGKLAWDSTRNSRWDRRHAKRRIDSGGTTCATIIQSCESGSK